jgi:hypothetical protein
MNISTSHHGPLMVNLLMLLVLAGCATQPNQTQTSSTFLTYSIEERDIKDKPPSGKQRPRDSYTKTAETVGAGYRLCVTKGCKNSWKTPVLSIPAFMIEQDLTYTRNNTPVSKEDYFTTKVNTESVFTVLQGTAHVGECSLRLYQSSVALRMYTEICDLVLPTANGTLTITTNGRILVGQDREPLSLDGVVYISTGQQASFKIRKK